MARRRYPGAKSMFAKDPDALPFFSLHPKTIVGRQVTTVKSHFVDLDTGAPRTDNILKAAGAVVGVIVLFAVVRKVAS